MKPEAHGGDLLRMAATAGRDPASLLDFSAKDKEITVKLKGGDLKIKVTDEAIYLTGDAVTVFNGSIII